MGSREGVKKSMSKSMQRVMENEDVIISLLRGGRILPVEGSDDEVCAHLDLMCGIDYFHVYDEAGITYGVASRFQEGEAYCTFTVRSNRDSGAMTEYRKRMAAMVKNGVYPYLTMHGYIGHDGKLTTLAIARTADIIECIDRELCYERHTNQDQDGQASFYCVRWDVMEEHGYKVLIYPRDAK